MTDVAAKLEGMVSMNFGDVVSDLINGRVATLRKRGAKWVSDQVCDDGGTLETLGAIEGDLGTLMAEAELVGPSCTQSPVVADSIAPAMATLSALCLSGIGRIRSI